MLAETGLLIRAVAELQCEGRTLAAPKRDLHTFAEPEQEGQVGVQQELPKVVESLLEPQMVAEVLRKSETEQRLDTGGRQGRLEVLRQTLDGTSSVP